MTTSRSFYAQRAPIFPSAANLMEPVDVELQSARCLFGEKVKELSVAVAKVDALTRQLEELRSGNTSNSYHVVPANTSSCHKVNQEYEKLRSELLHRNKLIDDQNMELNFKKSLLSQKKSELLQIDDRIIELQQRLAKKKQLNQQIQHQTQHPIRSAAGHPLSYSSLRSSVGGVKKRLPVQVRQATPGPNVAAVEPMQRLHHSSGDQVQNHVNIMHDVFLNHKQQQQQIDSKFQTLPHNTKFGRTGETGQISQGSLRESGFDSSLPIKCVTSDRGVFDTSSISIHVNGFGQHHDSEKEGQGIERRGKVDVVDRQAVLEKESSDWQKARRRPVIVDDDMERALSAPMSSNSSPEPDSKLLHKILSERKIASTTSGGTSPPPVPSPDHLQDIPSKSSVSSDSLLHLKNRSDRRDENGNESSDRSQHPQTNCVNGVSLSDKTLPPSSPTSSSPSSPSSSASSRDDSKHTPDSCRPLMNGWSQEKGSKGNLKNSQQSQSNGSSESRGMTRRVSFDPLALLLDAALEGELELVKKTAFQVPDPSAAKDEGLTALHNAICAGHFPIVRFLVEIGCDVNAQDSEGWTPLHCAASCNNLKMVEFLVEHGACVFATTFSDHETAAEKCEEEEAGFDSCSQHLYSIQEKMGVVNGGVVYAVYDYDAQNSDELSFTDGDRVVIVRKGDDQEIHWWWARSADREGYVPRTLFALFPRVRPRRSAQPADNPPSQ